MSKRVLFSLVLSAIYLSAARPSDAGVLATYTDRATFESVVSGLATETFDSLLSDTSFHETTLDLGDFSLLSSGNTLDPIRRNKVDVPTLEFGSFDVDGSVIANVSLSPAGSLLVTFDNAIMAFGADFAHLNNSFVRTTVHVGGETLIPSVAPTDDPRFFGFTSDMPLTTVEFRGVVGTSGDGFGIDNVSFSEACAELHSPVPEPGTLISYAALCFVAGGMRRRRRTA